MSLVDSGLNSFGNPHGNGFLASLGMEGSLFFRLSLNLTALARSIGAIDRYPFRSPRKSWN